LLAGGGRARGGAGERERGRVCGGGVNPEPWPRAPARTCQATCARHGAPP